MSLSPQDQVRIKNRIRTLIMDYCNNRERHYKHGCKKLHQMEALTAIRRKLAWYHKLTFKSHVKMVLQLEADLLKIQPVNRESDKNMTLAKKVKDMIAFCKDIKPASTQLSIAS